jgi:hypothetical protein
LDFVLETKFRPVVECRVAAIFRLFWMDGWES